MKPLRYLLVVLFPPASVYMLYGLSTTLVLNILLTFLGWIPGMIHALWVSVKRDETIGSENY